jgi:hypothetical protein
MSIMMLLVASRFDPLPPSFLRAASRSRFPAQSKPSYRESEPLDNLPCGPTSMSDDQRESGQAQGMCR